MSFHPNVLIDDASGDNSPKSGNEYALCVNMTGSGARGRPTSSALVRRLTDEEGPTLVGVDPGRIDTTSRVLDDYNNIVRDSREKGGRNGKRLAPCFHKQPSAS